MSCWLRSCLSTLAAMPELQPSCGRRPKPATHDVALQSQLKGRCACHVYMYGMLHISRSAVSCHASRQPYAVCVFIHKNTAYANLKIQAVRCVRSTCAMLTEVKHCCNLPSCFRTRKHPREGQARALDGNKRAVTSDFEFCKWQLVWYAKSYH